MRTKKIALITSIVAVVILALAFGMVLGKKQGETTGRTEAENRLNPLLDLAFPRPPEVMTSLTGVVKAIYGAIINLEVRDPNDYLPHTDGTAQSVEIRYAMVTSATKFFLLDFGTPDKSGSTATKIIKLSDIKVGDNVKVTSDTNIRDAERFDVTEVEIVRY
ncbi:MAG: hypothetical protein UY26_C0002G0157 [Candidatus Jorgensenbacteria bacterium GW2011_GWA1_48_13]|uniref:Uncharacterized protein n=2 Tax=Candidatus Joergenseniibacteriota TaxID=1752739 RepID=A0A0G1Z8K0_9BACT|nr:MAG: hypothetical protein UY26_C0002G0157 [Candidatus Jorgensenbacteria bacterium GW2011_GWA1_48_13]KKU98811.1 MAG: hypothetical protein UY32_C0013G0008 [Candidatus Jorgensenbacteria bacterium GW2011_GWC1_48_8]KKW15354.1 MAG: hypothetical protein UY55_C0001G0108 [Candidatus Jorgensenbacteria bacterium GW2011_GWB1_50_10]